MSVVAKYVAPAVIGVSSLVTLYQSRPTVTGTSAFVKGSAALASSVALQLYFIRRCALGGKPSNTQGVFAMIYPPLVLSLMAVSWILYTAGRSRSRLGVSESHPVYQYRLNDVIDRVRNIVGERTSSDDFRER